MASQDARFDWSDPLLLDHQLSSEEKIARDTARAYCRDKLAPRVLESFRHERTDEAIFREFGALDMLGIVIPEKYGGAGMNYVSYGLVAREVERIDSGLRSLMSVQGSLVMVPFFDFGTVAQKS
jgi:glutaryl-CoA dehydrogenase